MIFIGDKLIPKKYRLKKKGDFQKIFEHGKSFAGPYFVLYLKKKEEQRPSRIGFAVSKKMGTAVLRNKLKRKLREAIRPLIPRVKENYDIIVVARSRLKKISFQETRMQLMLILNKACLVKGDKE